MNTIRDILGALIKYPSITPNDADCQSYIMAHLKKQGFICQTIPNPPVSNLFATFGNQAGPLFLFAGHTDVVPIGDRTKWHTDPFTLCEKQGLLYGRGTADMKGSLAAMLLASERFIKKGKDAIKGRLGFLITSGEEGDDFQLGTPYVMSVLQQQDIHPDFCIVGEPSSSMQIGDVIKIGRRGSLTGHLVLQGKQGHVAYPHLAENPIHRISPALLELTSKIWDKGNTYFPPTSLQITHIQAGGEASNIIPGTLALTFNCRYSTEQTAPKLQEDIQALFERHGLQPEITWKHNGKPFLTATGPLLKATIAAIQMHTGHPPSLSTSGGTSDGRFIAPYGVEVIELGPINATIHQVNECVALADLETLSLIYYSICETLLS